MAKHRKYDLLETITDAINGCGWNYFYVSDISEHPFRLKIYNEKESYLVRIYIWNLTHGGGAKRPKDEYRIQITGVEQFEQQIGEKTLILGWWSEMGVFAGFDYTKHTTKLGFSPSIQIREDALRKAHVNGFSACDKGNQEIAIAFHPDFFVEYVRNLEQLHNYVASQQDLEIIEEVVSQKIEVNNTILQKVSEPRREAVLTISKKIRDSSFKSRVLTAYNHKCAVCGLQLKLIDAAHIIPVSYTNSTDQTSNGIALCALHHRAYDVSLITFNKEYQILFNEEKMKQLRKIGRDGGMEKFIKSLQPLINLPPEISDRPHQDYISVANSVRGWKL